MHVALLLLYLWVMGWGTFVEGWDESTFMTWAFIGAAVGLALGSAMRLA